MNNVDGLKDALVAVTKEEIGNVMTIYAVGKVRIKQPVKKNLAEVIQKLDGTYVKEVKDGDVKTPSTPSKKIAEAKALDKEINSALDVPDNNWNEIFDKNTKKVYYGNLKTKKTSWDRPKNTGLMRVLLKGGDLKNLKSGALRERDQIRKARRSDENINICFDGKNFSELMEFGGAEAETGPLQECKSIASIDLTGCPKLTSVGQRAFKDCSLESISLPDAITGIGNSAFGLCSDLSSVTLPNSVTSLGDYAFNNCISLESINIPENLTNFGKEVFSECPKLTPPEITKQG